MIKVLIFHLLLIYVQSKPIRLIPNSILLSPTTSIVFTNLSEIDCLCRTSSNSLAINYFDNRTCQIFVSSICIYELKINLKSQIYLPDASFDPFRSGCSMSGAALIRKLNTTTVTSVNGSVGQRSMIDDYGYFISLSLSSSYLERYNPVTLTTINRIYLNASLSYSFSYFNGFYFVSTSSNVIIVVNSTNRIVINTISSPFLQNPRDMIFLHNGQTLVVASSSDDCLVFFNRSAPGSTLYSYIYQIPFPHKNPYGLWRMNDTFFYVTSYTNKTIFSYSAVNSSFWISNLVIDVKTTFPNITGNGVRVTVDQCGRFWFSMNSTGVLIFDRYGSYIGRPPSQYDGILDTFIMNDSTIYFSRFGSVTSSQIYRLQLDPNC